MAEQPKPPTFDTLAELAAYVDEQVNQKHDYNTSAQALQDTAVATFNTVARLVGNSGFQASHAALGFYGAVMHVDGPFGIIKAHDSLYPQYGTAADRAGKWESGEDGWQQWLGDRAREQLAEYPDGPVTTTVEADPDLGIDEPFTSTSPHPSVYAHWQALAEKYPAVEQGASS